jgi:hypothetical protein
MARKLKFPNLRAGARNAIVISGTITLGASGAIASAAGFCPSAAASVAPGVVKTAAKTGRYTVTLDRKYQTVRPIGVSLEGPADTAMGNTDGNAVVVRNVGTQSFDIQTLLASSGADTNSTSGNKIHWAVLVVEM